MTIESHFPSLSPVHEALLAQVPVREHTFIETEEVAYEHEGLPQPHLYGH